MMLTDTDNCLTLFVLRTLSLQVLPAAGLGQGVQDKWEGQQQHDLPAAAGDVPRDCV